LSGGSFIIVFDAGMDVGMGVSVSISIVGLGGGLVELGCDCVSVVVAVGSVVFVGTFVTVSSGVSVTICIPVLVQARIRNEKLTTKINKDICEKFCFMSHLYFVLLN
jgi:hypothetical protein